MIFNIKLPMIKRVVPSIIVTLYSLMLIACSEEAIEKIDANNLLPYEIAVNPISAKNQHSYTISGTCNQHPQEISIALVDDNINSIIPKSQPLCQDGTWTTTLDTDNLQDGVVDIVVAIKDPSQGFRSTILRVMKDTVVPDISVKKPHDITPQNAASYQLSGTCSDHLGKITMDAGETVPTHSSQCIHGHWQMTMDMTNLKEGEMTIVFTHQDTAGNASHASPVIQRFGTAALTLDQHSLQRDPETKQSYFSLSGTCSRNDREVTVQLQDSHSNLAAPSPQPLCSNDKWHTKFAVSRLEDGKLQTSIQQVDILIEKTLCLNKQPQPPAFHPITICDYQGLKDIAKGLDKSYVLAGDIDASPSWSEGAKDCIPHNGHSVPPHNACSGWMPLGRFRGTLDGKNYHIRHLYLKSPQSAAGLFSALHSRATIKNLHLRSVHITNHKLPSTTPLSNLTGGLVGLADHASRIENSSVEGLVSGLYQVGGLAGHSHGKMANNYVNASVTGVYVGGLVGTCGPHCEIISSHVQGKVEGVPLHTQPLPPLAYYSQAGGLAGGLHGTPQSITYSYSLATVSGGAFRGGLAGTMGSGTIEHSYSAGRVVREHPQSALQVKSGGLVGEIFTGYYSNEWWPAKIVHSFWDLSTSGQIHSAPDTVGKQGRGLMGAAYQIWCIQNEQDHANENSPQKFSPCALKTGFVFERKRYPLVKKCQSCPGPHTRFTHELVGGQSTKENNQKRSL